MSLRAAEIREVFLAHFEERGHARRPSASLVPRDPTLLFVNAGMVPFKRVFTGEEPAPAPRVTTTQKVMRVSGKHNDLEEVGRSARHHTFFEMLGNFSFGDYFKQDAIRFTWELLTGPFGLTMDDLVVSVFREDDEAAAIWENEIGLPPGKIYRLDEAENFWSMGDVGPCGPCSEVHIDRGPVAGVPNDTPASESGRFLEFWNLVFMQYEREKSGVLRPLPSPSVDTGLGLERMAQILQGKRSNYETDLFTPLLACAQELSGKTLGAHPEHDIALRVVADHARAVAFLLGDGVLPGNAGRGYVLRRILRRASRYGVLLGLNEPFLHTVVERVIAEMGGAFPELASRSAYIIKRARREEERFLATLSRGLLLLEEEIARAKEQGAKTLPGPVAFRLYDTFGFPLDLTADIAKEHALRVDGAGFENEMSVQRARSRKAWKGSGDTAASGVHARIAADLATEFTGYESTEGESEIRALLVDGALVEAAERGSELEVVTTETPFYAESGGQVGDRGEIVTPSGRVAVADTQRPAGALVVHRGRVEAGRVLAGEVAALRVDAEARAATVRNHSGTHLLHAALRAVLGKQVFQRGSLVTPARLRFDFTHEARLEAAQLAAVEDLANRWIEANEAAAVSQMSYERATREGALALFDEKYGDDVRVVKFGAVSNELCGGTHARATGDIGLLKIVSESGIAAGVRRIEALTGLGALAHLREGERALARVAELLRVPPGAAAERVEKLLEERRCAEKEIAALRLRAASGDAAHADSVREIAGVTVLVRRVEGLEARALRGVVDALRARTKNGVVLVASVVEGRVALALGVTPALSERVPAGALVREVAEVLGGRGGGRADFAQAGGADPQKLDAAIERLHALVARAFEGAPAS